MGQPSRLLRIPKLPEELYELIKEKPAPRPAPKAAAAPATTSPSAEAPATATAKMLEDVRALCACLTVDQLDNYGIWRKLGIILKGLGAPRCIWEEQSKRSRKYKAADMRDWDRFPTYQMHLGSLMALAKSGNLEEYERIVATLHETKDVFDDDATYPCTVINTPYLTTRESDGPATHPDQNKFREILQEFVANERRRAWS